MSQNPQVYISFITGFLAAIVAWTGYQQHKLAKERLKLDLFEKRFAVYKAAQRFLSIILRDANFKDGELFEFRGGTQDGTFLFGPDIPDYIAMLDKKALDMKTANMQLEGLPKSDERSELVGKEMQLLKELTDELPRLKEVFAPYLRFDTWQSDKKSFCRLIWSRISKAKSV
ncbi:MAG: hypothetical protein H8E62_04845 [Planctomycetes bacterium]|nr:hypothetical protein [Planctomycetota bacterium]